MIEFSLDFSGLGGCQGQLALRLLLTRLSQSLKLGKYISIVRILVAQEFRHIHMVRMDANGCIPVEGSRIFWHNLVSVSYRNFPDHSSYRLPPQ